MRLKLTKRSVDALSPTAKDQLVWDTDLKGFGLKVTPAGRKIYVLQTRQGDGRSRRLTIGPHGSPWTVEEARKEAVRLLGLLSQGINPNVERDKHRRDMTVGDLIDGYFDEGCTTKKPSTLAVERGLAERHIRPLLGLKRVQSLDRSDVERFLADVEKGKTAADVRTRARGRAIVKGGKGTANRTLDLLAAMLSFAIARGIRPDNPAAGVKKFQLRKRDRFLSGDELGRLGAALADAQGRGTNPAAIAAIRFLLLTGLRKNEALSLRWDWVDLDRGWLRLPDSKTGAKEVRLGQAAVEFLRSLPRHASPFVFPSLKGSGHLVGLQKIWVRVRRDAGLGDLRVHDLRHHFGSVGASNGQSLYIVGKLLGHRQTHTTQRYAHLGDDPLRSAADAIADEIASSLRRQ